MSLLYGWQRKLALVPLAVFMVGWLIYAFGFIWMLVEWPEEEVKKNQYPSRESPLNFPYYVSLFVAPFLYFFAVLFIVLPGAASGVLGVVVSFLSTFYFVSAGWTVYESRRKLDFLQRSGYGIDLKLLFVFSGKLVEHLCWSLMLLLSVFYKYKKSTPERNGFLPAEENRQPNTHTMKLCFRLFCKPCNCQPKTFYCLYVCAWKACAYLKLWLMKCQSKKIPFTPGLSRLICVLFILSSVVSWCIFTVGFHGLFEDVDPESFYPFSFSICLILPPLLFLSALIHAAFPGGTGKVMGELAALLYVPYVVFLGYVLIENGQYLYNLCGSFEDDGPWEEQDWMCYDMEDLPSHMHRVYIFAGGISTLVFWSCVVSMWSFFRSDHPQPGDLERQMANVRSLLTLERELDMEQQQTQQGEQTRVYGSMRQNESYQVSFEFTSSSEMEATEGQLLLQGQSADDQQQNHDDQCDQQDHRDQYQGDQYDHGQNIQHQVDQYQNQGDQHEHNQYQNENEENRYEQDEYHREFESDHCHQNQENQQQDISGGHDESRSLISTERGTTV